MKKTAFFLCVIMLVSAVLPFGNVFAETDNLKDKTIVAFGDSLTKGTVGYLQSNKTYVAMLSEHFTDSTVINAGAVGDTTWNAIQRYQADVIAKNPDIVLICFGMNDQSWEIQYNRPVQTLEKYRAQLTTVIKDVQAIGADVILVTPNPVNMEGNPLRPNNDYGYGLMDDYCDEMRRLAYELDCGLVDINYEMSNRVISDYVSSDGIHQTVKGHEFYFECIKNHLEAVYNGVNVSRQNVVFRDSQTDEIVGSWTLTGAKGTAFYVPAMNLRGYECNGSGVASGFNNNGDTEMLYTPANEVNLSVGMTYTTEGKKHGSYPDKNYLTDGVKSGPDGRNMYGGFTDKTVSVIIDLGETQKSNVYNLYYTYGPWGISGPQSVKVYGSDDGKEFTLIGEASKKDIGDGVVTDGKTWKLARYTYTSESAPVEARYIKFETVPGNANHIWIDEAEVLLVRDIAAGLPKKGDVDGDGEIKAKDYMMVKRFYLGTFVFTDEQLYAADIDGDGEIKTKDYMMVKRHYLGTYNIPGWEE